MKRYSFLTLILLLSIVCSTCEAFARDLRLGVHDAKMEAEIDVARTDLAVFQSEPGFQSATFRCTDDSSGNRRSALPLAKDKHGLKRPKFQTCDFGLSMDVMSMDIGAIENLPGDKGRSVMGLSVKLGLVLAEEPIVRLLGGWTFFLDHDISNYTIAMLWQPVSFGYHGPLIGLGGGRIVFDFSDNGLAIYGGYTYPILIVGWTTIQPNFDLFLSFPFGEVSTTFENQQYTISPAGPTVSLMFSL